MNRLIKAAVLLLVVLALLPTHASAQVADPSQIAQQIRAALLQAQLALTSDGAKAAAQLANARQSYDALGVTLATTAPDADARVQASFGAAKQAVAVGDAPAFAAARAQVWAALLEGGARTVETALQSNDAQQAQLWLPVREFRQATRFSRPNADATRAVVGAVAGTVTLADALLAVRADLFDTYQARLTEALHDVSVAEQQGFAARRAEHAALAEGYFAILAPAYREQRGVSALAETQAHFATLRAATISGGDTAATLTAIEGALKGFRAAPLSVEDQARRAGQLLRFLSLVPVEYARGVRNGAVTKDLEIREAATFRDGAAAAFNDLQSILDGRDGAKTQRAAQLFATLESQIAAASAHTNVPEADAVQTTSDQLTTLLRELMPAEWQKRDSAADFDVIGSTLDQMEAAVAAGEYDLAESARLEAYAILESGPEAKLIVFAPRMKQPIEDLFWYGQNEQVGLAQLISDRAPLGTIKATRVALNGQLAEAQRAIAGNNAPVSVATNAAVIVFREGLEAVLILASLMGSLKTAEQRKYRRPMWWGVVASLFATVLTWLLAQGLLNELVRRGYHEKLEAVVSLIAIAVLLLITNWFFHQVYWNDWMATFHQQKKRILGGTAGQFIGLATLGFTSIYREGFETVLFLQALVLEAGTATVLAGVAIGLLATLLIGVVVFALQTKLPYKKMLIYTGIMIGVVLLQMVGNTVHIMQVVGWMPIHPIRWLELPYWMGMWFGTYATWEGFILQAIAGVFVIGSYYLAERMKHKPAPQPQTQRQAKIGGSARVTGGQQ